MSRVQFLQYHLPVREVNILEALLEQFQYPEGMDQPFFLVALPMHVGMDYQLDGIQLFGQTITTIGIFAPHVLMAQAGQEPVTITPHNMAEKALKYVMLASQLENGTSKKIYMFVPTNGGKSVDVVSVPRDAPDADPRIEGSLYHWLGLEQFLPEKYLKSRQQTKGILDKIMEGVDNGNAD